MKGQMKKEEKNPIKKFALRIMKLALRNQIKSLKLKIPLILMNIITTV